LKEEIINDIYFISSIDITGKLKDLQVNNLDGLNNDMEQIRLSKFFFSAMHA